MKKVRLLLGIGAFAAGALALYYFAKKKESATVQTMGPNEDSMKKEPTVSVEDRANVEETFGDYKATEVTEADTQETRVSAFKPAPGNRRIGQYDDEMNLIAEYDSATVAAEAVGSNRTSIRNCANGKQKHAGGFVWRYLDQQSDQGK